MSAVIDPVPKKKPALQFVECAAHVASRQFRVQTFAGVGVFWSLLISDIAIESPFDDIAIADRYAPYVGG